MGAERQLQTAAEQDGGCLRLLLLKHTVLMAAYMARLIEAWWDRSICWAKQLLPLMCLPVCLSQPAAAALPAAASGALNSDRLQQQTKGASSAVACPAAAEGPCYREEPEPLAAVAAVA
jgi:hypothetical protein